jgi:hypothetical protein
MADAKSLAGGCHCGAVRFEAAVDLAQVLQCNCSICMKRGCGPFVQAPQVEFLKGQDVVKDYQFGPPQ